MFWREILYFRSLLFECFLTLLWLAGLIAAFVYGGKIRGKYPHRMLMFSGIKTNKVSPLTHTPPSYRDVLASRLVVYEPRCTSHLYCCSFIDLCSTVDHHAYKATCPLRASCSK